MGLFQEYSKEIYWPSFKIAPYVLFLIAIFFGVKFIISKTDDCYNFRENVCQSFSGEVIRIDKFKRKIDINIYNKVLRFGPIDNILLDTLQIGIRLSKYDEMNHVSLYSNDGKLVKFKFIQTNSETEKCKCK